jgi:hypothetical protein
VRIAVFRYTPAAHLVLVDNVDTLPKELTRREQVLRDVSTSLQRLRRGGWGGGYDSELGVFATATMSMCASPRGLLA